MVELFTKITRIKEMIATPKKLWLFNKFSLSVLKETYREEYGEGGFWCKGVEGQIKSIRGCRAFVRQCISEDFECGKSISDTLSCTSCTTFHSLTWSEIFYRHMAIRPHGIHLLNIWSVLFLFCLFVCLFVFAEIVFHLWKSKYNRSYQDLKLFP